MSCLPERLRIRTLRWHLPLLALAATLASGAGTLHAQGGGDEQPAIAMGAGRMVRGTVTAVTGDHLTLKTEAGDAYTVALTPNTQVRHNRDPLKASDIHAGDGIGAMGEIDRPNRTVHALFVQIVTAEEVKKMKDALGKTWIAGTVTAMNEVKLTILRPDKVTQTIQVDEDTSFKRGGRNMQAIVQGGGNVDLGSAFGGGGGGRNGAAAPPPAESITLADVKIGDNVAGQGALKNGVFFPKELLVGDPTTQRRRREGGAGAAPAGTQAGPK